MSTAEEPGLSPEELAAEEATGLPDKEVVSLLDLNADLDLDLDVAAPIDLAVAANANVAAPIDAAVGANVLSYGSTAQSLADQGVLIDQGISADAIANANQDSALDQGAGTADAGAGDALTGGDASGAGGQAVGAATDAVDGDLLNVNVDLAANADLAAPIAGAVAANANVAAPIDAAAAANVGSVDSDATAIADQDAIITQHIDGSAQANADQESDINQ
jgi:hypothetical protein